MSRQRACGCGSPRRWHVDFIEHRVFFPVMEFSGCERVPGLREFNKDVRPNRRALSRRGDRPDKLALLAAKQSRRACGVKQCMTTGARIRRHRAVTADMGAD